MGVAEERKKRRHSRRVRARLVFNNFPARATSAASVSVALGLAVKRLKRLKRHGPEKEGRRRREVREVRAADPTGFPQFRRDREKGGED